MDISLSKKHTSNTNLTFKKILKEIGRNAQIDWLVILFLSAIIVIILFAGGAYLYDAVVTGTIQGQGTPEVVNSKPLNTTKLSSIITAFNAKENATSLIKSGASIIADPSL